MGPTSWATVKISAGRPDAWQSPRSDPAPQKTPRRKFVASVTFLSFKSRERWHDPPCKTDGHAAGPLERPSGGRPPKGCNDESPRHEIWSRARPRPKRWCGRCSPACGGRGERVGALDGVRNARRGGRVAIRTHAKPRRGDDVA